MTRASAELTVGRATVDLGNSRRRVGPNGWPVRGPPSTDYNPPQVVDNLATAAKGRRNRRCVTVTGLHTNGRGSRRPLSSTGPAGSGWPPSRCGVDDRRNRQAAGGCDQRTAHPGAAEPVPYWPSSASGILGQYEPGSTMGGCLLLVYPKRHRGSKRQLRLEPSDFRLWVCLARGSPTGCSSPPIPWLVRPTCRKRWACLTSGEQRRRHAGWWAGWPTFARGPAATRHTTTRPLAGHSRVCCARRAVPSLSAKALDQLLVLGNLVGGPRRSCDGRRWARLWCHRSRPIRSRFDERRHRKAAAACNGCCAPLLGHRRQTEPIQPAARRSSTMWWTESGWSGFQRRMDRSGHPCPRPVVRIEYPQRMDRQGLLVAELRAAVAGVR